MRTCERAFDAVAFLPGANELAAAEGGSITVFGVPELRELRTLTLPPFDAEGGTIDPGRIAGMAFRPGGEWFAVTLLQPSGHGEEVQDGVFVCDATTGACRRAFPERSGIVVLKWDPRGRFLAGIGPGSLFLWDADTDAILLDLSQANAAGFRPGAIGFSPNGKRAAVAPEGAEPFVLDLAACTRSPIPAALAALRPTTLLWAADGTLLAVVRDRAVMWDLGAAEARAVRMVEEASPDDLAGSLAFTWDAGGLQIWALPTLEELADVRLRGELQAAAVDETGGWVALATESELRLLSLAEAQTSEPEEDPEHLRPPPKPVEPRIETAPGLRLVRRPWPLESTGLPRAAVGHGVVAISGPRTEIVLRTIEPLTVRRVALPYACESVALHPAEPQMAVSLHSGVGFLLIDTRSGKKRVVNLPWSGPPKRLVWSPDGRFLVAVGPHGALVRDMTANKLVFEERSAADWVSFSPDGTRLAFKRKLVDTTKWAPVPLSEAAATSVLLAGPQDQLLCATLLLQVTEERAVVRALPSGAVVDDVRLEGDAPPVVAAVRDLPPSERGRALVTVKAPAETWRLWDLATGERLAEATVPRRAWGELPAFTTSVSGMHVLAFDGRDLRVFARA